MAARRDPPRAPETRTQVQVFRIILTTTRIILTQIAIFLTILIFLQ